MNEYIVSPRVLVLRSISAVFPARLLEVFIIIFIMDLQAQHTPPKDGTDGKEAEEEDNEKDTEGQEVRTEVNHQESGNMLGETTSTSTGYGPDTFNKQTSAAEATSSETQTKPMDGI